MSSAALTLALAAAVLHAFWNILLARSQDPVSATAVALLTAIVAFAPVTLAYHDVEREAWPFIAVTSVFQLVYFGLLASAYRRAELSFVYPVARGLAPVVVLLAGVVATGSATSATQVAGVLLVCLGVVLVRGLRRPVDVVGLAFALGIAACIATYTLIDKQGIEHASPIAYLELSMIPATLGYVAVVVTLKGRRAVRREVGAAAVAAGLASFGAYALVLTALARASAASVAAVRETSVVFATVGAAIVLRERVGPTRLVGAALVAAGVALLS